VQVTFDATAGGIGGSHNPHRDAISAARASALAIAVASSSANPSNRSSVSGGSSCREDTPMTPHSFASAPIGAPAAERTPAVLAMSMAWGEASL
jgi:hypothetical protein